MDDLIKEFVDETMESLSEMDLDLVKLEQDPEDQELLGKVFRLMHTIKGTCGFIGLPRLEKTAHAGENLLDNFRSGKMEITESAMTVLFMCIDRVRFLINEVNKAGAEPAGDDVDITSLIEKEIADALGGGGAVPPQPEASEAPSDSPPDSSDNGGENGPEASVPSEGGAVAGAGTEKSAGKQGSASEKGPEYLRVQMTVLEDLINMVSELVLTRNQLLQLTRMEEGSSLNTPLQRLNRIVSDLQDNVMKTRMQPIGNAWSKLPRIVRDLASDMQKKIVLEMEGEDTELDRQVLELIRDPLTHMVRNSCDHGIETPDERLAAEKEEAGTILLKAYHEGGFIIIELKDDGKGLDAQKIAAKAVEKGLVDAAEAEKMSEKQLLHFIMKPGFSTAEAVTSVSGRGVGMDVVRENIEKIGGSIDMESQVGVGTSFSIQIPLTLAIISALIVEIDDHRYAIPQMNIQELVSLGESQRDMIEYINEKPVLRLRDRIISLLDSSVLFESEKSVLAEGGDDTKMVVIISSGSSHYGVIVDKIFDTEEVVIKSVSSVLKDANVFSGNTILGDGQVIMILDPAAIARKFNVEKESGQLEDKKTQKGKRRRKSDETASMLVFKAGDGTMKAVPLAMVSRLQVFSLDEIDHSADKMVVQFNDALMQLAFIDPQTQKLPEGEEGITSIVLSDDRSDSSLGLVIDEVVDIVDGVLDLTISTKRSGILGSMILGEETVDVIDIAYFLGMCNADWFSTAAHSGAPYVAQHLADVEARDGAAPSSVAQGGAVQKYTSKKPTVLVVDDSRFFRDMLHPILASAGYDVTLSEDALSAIQLHDEGYVFDVILSDIEMPGMDGYEFVEKMREESAWKDTPFIAISSHSTPADMEYGYKKGFNKYIGKFDRDELIESLGNIHSIG